MNVNLGSRTCLVGASLAHNQHTEVSLQIGIVEMSLKIPRSFSMLFMLAMVLLASGTAAASAQEVIHLARTDNEPLIDATFLIVHEAYRRLGMDAVEDNVPGARSVQELNDGKVFGDVMHFKGLENSYPNVVRVPVAVTYFEAVAFTDGRDLHVTDWASARGYRVCIRRGIKAIEVATTGMKNVEVVNQYESIFAMLKAGHCDIAILPSETWLEVRRLNITGLRSLEPPLQIWPLYHYVNKAHADIVPALTHVLLEMQKSGELARKQADFNRLIEQAKQ